MVFFHAISCVSLCDFNLYKSVKKFKQEKTCHMQSKKIKLREKWQQHRELQKLYFITFEVNLTCFRLTNYVKVVQNKKSLWGKPWCKSQGKQIYPRLSQRSRILALAAVFLFNPIWLCSLGRGLPICSVFFGYFYPKLVGTKEIACRFGSLY